MQVMSRNSTIWNYLEPDLQGLIHDGECLMDFAEKYKGQISDFSYLVFPFAKAYEGFLKKLMLDLNIMREDEYYSDDIRIGRVLNPRFIEENGHMYRAFSLHKKGGEALVKFLWETWTKGRNQVFHYFPHNFRSLSLNEALEIVHGIIEAMTMAVGRSKVS